MIPARMKRAPKMSIFPFIPEKSVEMPMLAKEDRDEEHIRQDVGLAVDVA